jgi:hypothetical protein
MENHESGPNTAVSGPQVCERCEHCDARLHGQFCAHCAQNSTPPVRPLKKALAEAFSELISLDLRFPRTVRALAIPGRLTSRYLCGHRVPYISPLRFALSASILLLVLVALRLPAPSTISVDGGLGADLAYIASSHPIVLVRKLGDRRCGSSEYRLSRFPPIFERSHLAL